MLRSICLAAVFAAGVHSNETLEGSRHELNVAQQERLNAILNGVVDKSEVEIVLARFDENLDWAELYSPIVTVYNKGESMVTDKFEVRPLQNKGREGNT
jgi:hypothetical protein